MPTGGRRKQLSTEDSDDENEHLTTSGSKQTGNEDTSCWTKFCMCCGIACCIDEDEFTVKELAEVVQDKQRTCTDVPCLLILIAVIISQIALISYADSKGANTKYLLHGTDYNGSLCDGENGRGKLTAWVDLTESYKVRVCVDSCSETQSNNSDNSLIIESYPSKNAFDRFCIPKNSWLKDNKNEYNFDSTSATLERGIADLDTTKWLIVGITFFSLFVAMFYIYLVAKIARILVYLSILIIFIGLGVLGAWLCVAGKSDINNDETKSIGKVELGFGILVFIILIILFLSFFWCRKRIELAFEMLEQASKALFDMKSTLFFPLIYSLFVMGYFAVWILLTLYLFSVQTKDRNDMPTDKMSKRLGSKTYVDYDFDKSMKNAVWWDIISLVYIMQVITYFGYMVLAGTFSDWYFSEWDDEFHHKLRGNKVAELSDSPVTESCMRVCKFHIGSLAFGALLITPIRIIRGVLTYIQAKTEAQSNFAVKCIFCCVQCCLKCCQSLINAINKEGFILTTIWGSNYCYSGITAIKIITKNLGRAAMIEGISEFMEIFGRICVAAISTGLAIIILYYNDYYQDHVSSVFVPVIVIFFISLIISSLFLMVYEVAVDSIFMCYLIDEQVHKGTTRFAHQELYDYAQKAEKRNKNKELNPV